MIQRIGLLVAASVAAYAVGKFNIKSSKQSANQTKHSENAVNEDTFGKDPEKEKKLSSADGEIKKMFEEEDLDLDEVDVDVEEEKEEVKLINEIIPNSAPINNTSDIEDEIFPEFESLLSGEIDFPIATDKYDDSTTSSNSKADGDSPYDNTEMAINGGERDVLYESEMAINGCELERLRSLVKELEEREVKLEGELLEYYGLKEQESDIYELHKQLKIKSVEIEMLNITINTLQSERKKLQEEVAQGVSVKKELEFTRNKMKEMQRQIQLEANQTKGHLLLLKQQVSGLQEKEEEALRRDVEVEKKLKALKELEVEVVELKRKNKELQHEKRELVVKLDAAEANITSLSNMTQNDMVAHAREDINNLRHTNEDLLKQVEGLQMNRFSEVEELVYLRWVNACLRYELRNYQTPVGKASARDLSKSLSPRSQEKAKQLMMEYAGSERGQGGDTDLESNFSHPSSPGSDDFDNASMDSSMSRYSSISKKPSLIQKIKKWGGGRSKDDLSGLTSPARSFGSPGRINFSSHKPRGPLEALMIRNAGDNVAITSFGTAEQESLDSPDASLNSVSDSFHLMSKSVEGVLEDKYPAYKDRHKLAVEREKQIKEKADQARAARFSDTSGCKAERIKPVILPSKLTHIKEKTLVSTGDSSDQLNDIKVDSSSKIKMADIEKRLPRVPRPPPKPSGGDTDGINTITLSTTPGGPPPQPPPPGARPPPPPPGGPPRPPPPPGALSKPGGGGDKVHRAPEVVEFYQSMMKREAKKDSSPLITSSSNTSDARSNMIGEIANKSTFLLAVKADVETQGEFVQSLATEVRVASFTKIGDLVAFVNWLDEELSFLVDERAVLKHFEWPEGKADALREAAFEYQDLLKLEKQVTSFVDDPNLSCDSALKKMYKLLEKVEQSVYALLRTRDMAISRYKDFGIPVDWLQDSGLLGKIKLSSVQLARKYMKRVASELDTMDGAEKEPNREFLALQGIRFAFRVHQFAGGFDTESMKAFEELRSRVQVKTGDNKTPES